MNREFRQLRLSQLDRNINGVRSVPPRRTDGWIASVRQALALTLEDVGKRLHASRQAVQQLEKAEAKDRITLGALRRAAEAMGCELVYALVPRDGSFSELAEQPTRDRATRDVKSVMHTMMLEDQKPENASQLIEDEAQRRLNRG
jgi:predicted DNA-binding mobile mystery protein A